MSSKEKKKSSKGEDRKQQKKGDEITIVVDRSNTESAVSPSKVETDHAVLDSGSKLDDALNGMAGESKEERDEEPKQIDDGKPISDATKLTEILVESFEGTFHRGMYDGPGKCNFYGGNCYEGEFSEGMMHGQGMFTWADGLKYEGEFLHNNVTGKGTYTWPNGSTYVGDVTNGLRDGVGTFVDASGKLSYTGEWSQGKRNGKGCMSYGVNNNYDGEWVQNIRYGQGTRQYPSGNVYKGMWFNNVRHGDGTMKWIDTNQMYIGQWEDGVQHGLGQHVWFVRRIPGSQYALRNTYNGEFVKGIRHGYGTFYYANGAKYEGYWYNNMKHGKGRFTFKNGRYYEGLFESDHIKEYPNFDMDGTATPDQEAIRTRTPLPMENMSVHSNASMNTLGPSFQIDLQSLIKTTDLLCDEDDSKQVANVIKRHMSALKKVYDYYSCLGYYESSDNTFILSHIQFWRMMKDCQLHYKHLTLMDMDRILEYESDEAQNPHDRILFRQFINHLITLSVHLFHKDYTVDGSVMFTECINQLLTHQILKNGCRVKGQFFHQTRRAVIALEYLDDAYQVFKSACKSHKKNAGWLSMRMRDFLFLMRDLKLINSDLTAECVVRILTDDNPNATDEQDGYNLELEITFLEFFEALVRCAQFYVTEAVAKDPSSSPALGSSGGLVKSATLGGQLMDQMSMISEQTSGRSGIVGEGEDDADAKSSLAANMTPRSVSPSAPVPQTAASATDRVQSSIVAGGVPSKSKTDVSDSMVAAGKVDSAKAVSMHQQGSVLDGTSENPLDVDKEELERDIQDVGEDGFDLSDEIDETRKFNFWTHQLFIFFVMKFFPAYHSFATLKQLVKEKDEDLSHLQPDHAKNCICRGKLSLCPQTIRETAASTVDLLAPPEVVTPAPSLPEED